MPEVDGRLASALADRYVIEREIGRGGMATVYLAADVKHQRPVALKVLTADLAATLGAERFLSEIRVTARLSHPHILPLHDSGEAGGFLYYTMPLVEGESLRARLTRDPQLPVDEALRITEQVAGALDYAHRHGVIHRDIKPENILLHEGEAQVADFGIALAVSAAGGERLTETGLFLGTPAYMSPEQVAGDQALDARSDVYALACVLYEMLTGGPPFTGPTTMAVLARQVTDPVPPIRTVRPGVSPSLAAGLSKALAKAPVDRFASATAFAAALTPDAGDQAAETSIVVLPFDDWSPEADNQYFSDGLTEEIIADLSMLDSLRVISRTSAMQLRNTDKHVREIARLLDVQYVLEGSVRKAGNKLRITAQLVDANADKHVWTQKYDGVLEDVFDIQEEVSRKIVEALKGRVTPEDKRQLVARPAIRDVGIYEVYARARFEFWGTEPRSQLQKALHLLEEAVRVFGEHPLLLSGIGAVHWQFYHQLGDLSETHLTRIQECAEKLFAVDPGSPHGHRLASYMDLLAGNSEGAIRGLRQAMAGDPNDSETLLWLSYLLTVHAGRPAHAGPVVQRWAAIDPLHPVMPESSLLVQWMEGSIDQALPAALARWHREGPANHMAGFYLGHLLAWVGRREESLRVAEAMVLDDPKEGMAIMLRFLALAVHGRRDEALAAVSPEAATWFWADFHGPWMMAEGYAVLGAKDEALRWLERAVQKGNFNYPVLSAMDPFLESVRSEDRFQRLMVDVKRRWEAFGRELQAGVGSR